MCSTMPGGSYWRLLVRATINIQALGDLTNPSVLWLKYHINTCINRNGIFGIQHSFFFCIFSIVKNDHGALF